jgi:acetoacetyl-CoA synthetase
MSAVRDSVQPQSPISLRCGSGGPALFLVPGLTGSAAELTELGRNISTENAVYCLQAPGLDGEEAPLDSVEALAAVHLATIRRQQPKGPYLIAGYSFGGLIALEITQALTEMGEQPALLAFLECYTHPQHWPLSARLEVVAGIAGRRVAMLARSSPRDIGAYVAARAGGLSTGRGARASEPTFRWFHHAPCESDPESSQAVFRASVIAYRRYRPRPYAGRIAFFQPRTRGNFPSRPARMWRRLSRQVEVQTVAGDHLSMVGAESADLAARLSLCISRSLDLSS